MPYAGRVYDEKEMVNLVDSSLEFWLTSGRIVLWYRHIHKNWNRPILDHRRNRSRKARCHRNHFISALYPALTKKRENFARLESGLSDLEDCIILPKPCENSIPSWFGFMITCREAFENINYIIVSEFPVIDKTAVPQRTVQ